MTEGRPSIPAAMKRAVLEESGYACAVPSCRATPVEIAHIEPWAKVQEHTFDNLIALCPNHHTRFDVEKSIPAASVHAWKANLAVLNGRYSELERRLLEEGAKSPANRLYPIHRSLVLMIRNLLQDQILGKVLNHRQGGIFMGGQPTEIFVAFTPKGLEFIKRWQDAQPLDGSATDGT